MKMDSKMLKMIMAVSYKTSSTTLTSGAVATTIRMRKRRRSEIIRLLNCVKINISPVTNRSMSKRSAGKLVIFRISCLDEGLFVLSGIFAIDENCFWRKF